MNSPTYIGKRYKTDSASCKHDQNRSMSVGSRKAVRCGLGFDLDLPAPLNNAYHGKVIYQGVSVLWGRTISLEKLEKCEKKWLTKAEKCDSIKPWRRYK